MAHINRRFIDKHWGVSITRGILATGFGCLALFGLLSDFEVTMATIAVFLLLMGIIDSILALYASVKKHGWLNSIIDAIVDVVTAVLLLFLAKSNITLSVIILAIYTIVSGIIDLLHAFLSTVDPTDRFIKILAGAIGVIIGFAILNSGELELMTFIRFFGTYMLIVGVTSLIYGVHNHAQNTEDLIARREVTSKKRTKKQTTKRKR